jgi:hypothetical protein
VFDKATGTYLRHFGSPGSGPGQLLKPFGLAVDHRHIYVADNGNYRIQVRLLYPRIISEDHSPLTSLNRASEWDAHPSRSPLYITFSDGLLLRLI